jgi:TonB family protein
VISSNRTFQAALIFSALVHVSILLSRPGFFDFIPAPKEKPLEISYLKTPPQPLEYKQNKPAKAEPLFKLPARITADRRAPPPFIEKKPSLPKPDFTKPSLVKPDIIAVKKRISLPAIGIDKINNPSYISYYQIVREKIKRAAYQNYARTETGEVYLAFIISDDGYIRDMRVVEEKSSPNPYLREIASRSVKDASPFPNFPKELDYQQLSFNVVISFEIE